MEDVSTVNGDQINVQVRWTLRSINRLGLHPDGGNGQELSEEEANAICSPVIEFGKEGTYRPGSSENMIAELDADTSQCGIKSDEPAAVRIEAKSLQRLVTNTRLNFAM